MGASVSEISNILNWVERPPDGKTPVRVLDIGAQNLVVSSEDDIKSFIGSLGDAGDGGNLDIYAAAMAAGARLSRWGSINGSWLGELLTRVGMDYIAYDIFPGQWTTIFDLNTQIVLPDHRASFDLVLNCGTSEHVLNQYNVFKTIHDACRVDGIMYHAIPIIGFLSDGYFTYTPSFFHDLAHANAYEILDTRIRGPGPSKDTLQLLAELGLPMSGAVANAADWNGVSVADTLLAVTLRKTTAEPFRAPLLTRATVGPVADAVRQAYNIPPADQSASVEPLSGSITPEIAARVRAILNRFGDTTFPGLSAEALIERTRLEIAAAEQSPNEGLTARLHAAERALEETWPLLRLSRQALDRAESEAGISDSSSETERFWRAVIAFHEHMETGRIEEYPLILELTVLNYAADLYPDDWPLMKSLALCAAKLIGALRPAGPTA